MEMNNCLMIDWKGRERVRDERLNAIEFLMEPCEHLIAGLAAPTQQRLSTQFPYTFWEKASLSCWLDIAFIFPRLVPPIISTPSIDSPLNLTVACHIEIFNETAVLVRVRGQSRLSTVRCKFLRLC